LLGGVDDVRNAREPNPRKVTRIISQHSFYSISAKKVSSFQSCGISYSACTACSCGQTMHLSLSIHYMRSSRPLFSHVTMYSMTTQFGGSICCHCLSTAWQKIAGRWLCFALDFPSACCCHLFKYIRHPLHVFIQRFSSRICKFIWNSPVPHLNLREDTPSPTIVLEKSMNRIQQKCPMFQFCATGLRQANLSVSTGVVFKLSPDTSSATTS
jgi:hypothetical protein